VLETLLTWISDLLWPRRCVQCGAVGTELCAGCRGSLTRAPAARTVNGMMVLSAGTLADDALSRIIWNCKYRNLPHLARPLAAWLADTVGQLPDTKRLLEGSPLVVPVPLHPHRFAERGYNQAELLASALAGIMALPLAADALVRVHNTTSQVQRATRQERLANMKNAFDVPHPDRVKGRDIIIVDDVSTTGATLTACAVALTKAGARSVTGMVVARG